MTDSTLAHRTLIALSILPVLVASATATPIAPDEPMRITAEAPHDNMQFGCDVAIDGDLVVVGAFNDIGHGDGGGAGHVLRLQGDEVVDRWHLVPDGGASGGMCGVSVAIDGEVVVLGAAAADDVAVNAGLVHVHRYDPVADAWPLEQTIPAPDGREGDFFGSVVAVDGDLLAVSAPGRDTGAWYYNGGEVSVFRHDGTQWTLEATLQPSDPDIGAAFGESLAIDGGVIVVGAPKRDTPAVGQGGDNAGGAYVFEFQPRGGWTETAILETGVAGDLAGGSVAVRGDLIAMGVGHPCDAGMGCGLVRVHRRDGAGWSLDAELQPAEPCAFDFFGERLALHGDELVVSARCTRLGDGTATVHRFERGPTGWTTLDPVAIPDRPELVLVGYPVALGDGRLLAGAMHDAAAGPLAGAVFAWTVPGACPADLDGDGAVGGGDLALLFAGWTIDGGAGGAGGDPAGDPVGDLNGDGQVDGADLPLLLAAWGPCAS